MDQRLVAWARAVKARRGPACRPLWLFTDEVRTPDPVRACASLPQGLCGVVLRDADGPTLRRVARLCRARGMPLSVAGWPGSLPPGAGRHLRRGWGARRPGEWRTSSAHGAAELARAWRAGASPVFLSPAYATASHPGAGALGPWRWAALTRSRRGTVCALGGIDGQTVRRLPRWIAGVGAIGALLP